MSTPFQNRLVGTIIVAAVAIIVLPDLLDGEKNRNQADFENIPQAPQFESTREIKTFPEEKLDALPQEQVVDEVAVEDQTEENTPANVVPEDANTKIEPVAQQPKTKQTKPEQTTTSLPEKAVAQQAWVIQLGSFRDKNNVNALVKKLRASGYTTFTRPVKTKTGELTKVFIGPELIQSKLEKQLPKLEKEFSLKGRIARFSPTNN
ncbi:SPOR domain-containing protein [Thalassotalea agarivorans]|uniref:DedD protein n=1 Tax=Thalassotalea agarivorans TaxID=349064 RepID=A0A1H9ZMZ9_THASX|nr:SPOR domain-containing protein [Thalassotalea agarivorans]SES83131.1 DedD protein [Thalassotalea agarivorans]